jgi:hypothetical protein
MTAAQVAMNAHGPGDTMNRRITFPLLVLGLTACLLTACMGADASIDGVVPEADVAFESDTSIQGRGNDDARGQGRGSWRGAHRKGRWSPRYAEAVAVAEARAENGGSANAVATAFADALRANGYWRDACAANAIAVAEAVAVDSCTGAITVARAVASVTC